MSNTAEPLGEVQDVPTQISQICWSSLRRRMGQFRVTAEMLEDDAAGVFAFMGECIVTRCEHRWDSNVFEYSALSWQFRELKNGELSPPYVWEKDDDGTWIARKEVTR